MAGSVNKIILDLPAMYADGKSIPQISDATGLNRSRVRTELLRAGAALRTRKEAISIREGLGVHAKGKTREFTPEWKANIAQSRKAWADENAAGVSLKPSGYIEITRGENKGRTEHVIIMERRLGRRLRPDEIVHHIDEDRSNNSENNLALMTRSGHARHHRMIERISKCQDQ